MNKKPVNRIFKKPVNYRKVTYKESVNYFNQENKFFYCQ
jgi:hypothetical protein